MTTSSHRQLPRGRSSLPAFLREAEAATGPTGGTTALGGMAVVSPSRT
jgi:hypothetical protein